MIKEINFNFSFKGSRDYIQGTDIIDDSLRLLSKDFDLLKIEDFKYSGHEMLKGNAIGILSNVPQKAFNSLITFKYQDSTFYLSIISDLRQISSRVGFSEDPVNNELQIDDFSCKMRYNPSFTLTEQIVSMNKRYLQESVSKDGKWIVTKLEYLRITEAVIKPREGSVINIHLEKNMKNRLTRSSVKYNNDRIGNVFFSLI